MKRWTDEELETLARIAPAARPPVREDRNPYGQSLIAAALIAYLGLVLVVGLRGDWWTAVAVLVNVPTTVLLCVYGWWQLEDKARR